MEIKIKRAYEPSSSDDGYRVYIDRLWPRGLSHETFHYDIELKSNPAFGDLKRQLAGKPVVTLLYSSHDSEHNNAVVLEKLLKE